MTDLLLPIIIIILMLELIDILNKWPQLLLTGFMFLPVSWLFTYQLRDGVYTELFAGDISAYLTDLYGLELTLSLIMWFVPMLIFMKLIWIGIERKNTRSEING